MSSISAPRDISQGASSMRLTRLLEDTLRKEFGFQGFVVSDWGSTYSTAATVNAGMDLEMPGGAPMQEWIARPKTQQAGNGAGWLTADKVLSGGKSRRNQRDHAQ